jgi:molecular chaperone DnaJ
MLNGKGNGDLLITVVVQVPKKLSKVQRELMRQLEDSLKVENKPAAPSFMDKMKDLFS